MNSFEIFFRDPWYLLALIPAVLALIALYRRTPQVIRKIWRSCNVGTGTETAK